MPKYIRISIGLLALSAVLFAVIVHVRRAASEDVVGWREHEFQRIFKIDVPMDAEVVENEAADFISIGIRARHLEIVLGVGPFLGLPNEESRRLSQIQLDGAPARLYERPSDQSEPGRTVLVLWADAVGRKRPGVHAKAECTSEEAQATARRIFSSIRFTNPELMWPPELRSR